MRILRLAIRQTDINNLQEIVSQISDPEILRNPEVLHKIRVIFGEIVKHLNELSSLYNSGMEGLNVSAELQKSNLINDLNNLNTLKQLVGNIVNSLQSIENTVDQETKRIILILNKLGKYINSINFSEKQISDINKLLISKPDTQKRKKVNPHKMKAFLTSFYSTSSGWQRTLKVIREILQNSCDAIKRTNKEGSINISTYSHPDNKSMDMVVQDDGVGMDWETLSSKFFVCFESGKEEEEGMTGGYGIAKELIQETPKEGWSIETNDIYSNRFHKNIYEGDEQYSPQKLDITITGTTITLYNIPFVEEYFIMDLMQKYVSMSKINFMLNGVKINPRFNETNITFFDSVGKLTNSISENKSEKESIAKNLESITKENDFNMSFSVNNTTTTIKFATNTSNNYCSTTIFFLNGQYQFDQQNIITGINILCFINTNAKPSTEEYPMDASREHIKEPYQSKIMGVINNIVSAIKVTKENELFKEGLDIKMVNGDNDFLKFQKEDDWKIRSMIKSLSADTTSTLWSNYEKEQKAKIIEDNILQKLIEDGVTLDQNSKNIINDQVFSMLEQNITTEEDISKIIENIYNSIKTKFGIIIQKEFMSEITPKVHTLLVPLGIIWEKALRVIGSKILSSQFSGDFYEYTNIAPGVIFSKDVIGLTMREKEGRNYNLILINPLSIASSLWPQDFETIQGHVEKETVSDISKERAETPIKRITSIILHIAIHELGHVCIKYDSGFEIYHKTITFLEMICDNEQTRKEIYEIVKENMPELKREFKKLITTIKKDKQKAMIQKSFNLEKLRKN